jgi:ankyrin repeat protein
MQLRTLAAAAWICIAAASVHAQNPAAPDPMYAAIRSGEVSRVEALLSAGADVNVKERRGGATPLMLASAFGSIDTMRMLIDKGADVNARSGSGATALMWAATDLAKIRLLLDRGADVNAVSTLGRSVLLLAALSDGSAEIVKFLLSRGADARIVAGDKMTTLLAAAIGNDSETLRLMLEAGVDVNAADAGGMTPLMRAAENGNTVSVTRLLAKGADVTRVSVALEAFAPGKVKNGFIALGSFTALHRAVASGPLELVNALIAAGADVNAREGRGMTPLMLAVSTDHGDVRIVDALLAAGADASAKSLAGETAADWAMKSGRTKSFAALKKSGALVTAATPQLVPAAAPVAARVAVERGIAVLERATGTFFVNGACGSCHAHNITDIATMAARRHGVVVDEEAARQRINGGAARFASLASAMLERMDGPAVDIQLYTLASMAASDYQPDRATDALVFNVAAQQLADGRWHVGGIARPPMADGDVSRTALALRALKRYPVPGRAAEMTARTDRAAAWLRAVTPVTTEDHVFRLLGLSWAASGPQAVQQYAKALIALQRADGGWGQRPEMSTDAYATGLAIVALRESRVDSPAAAAAIRRGSAYLLSTQRADGTWFVRSRAPKFQPYFDGGFPYEHNQWISAMATGWATTALAGGLEDTTQVAGR